MGSSQYSVMTYTGISREFGLLRAEINRLYYAHKSFRFMNKTVRTVVYLRSDVKKLYCTLKRNMTL